MCAKTVKEEFGEEHFWAKENEPQRQLLADVFNESPDVSQRAGLFTSYPCLATKRFVQNCIRV